MYNLISNENMKQRSSFSTSEKVCLYLKARNSFSWKDQFKQEVKRGHEWDGCHWNSLQVLCNVVCVGAGSRPPLPPGPRLGRPARGLQVGVRHSNILQCCSVPLCRHHYRSSCLGVAVSYCNGVTLLAKTRLTPSSS